MIILFIIGVWGGNILIMSQLIDLQFYNHIHLDLQCTIKGKMCDVTMRSTLSYAQISSVRRGRRILNDETSAVIILSSRFFTLIESKRRYMKNSWLTFRSVSLLWRNLYKSLLHCSKNIIYLASRFYLIRDVGLGVG